MIEITRFLVMVTRYQVTRFPVIPTRFSVAGPRGCRILSLCRYVTTNSGSARACLISRLLQYRWLLYLLFFFLFWCAFHW